MYIPVYSSDRFFSRFGFGPKVQAEIKRSAEIPTPRGNSAELGSDDYLGHDGYFCLMADLGKGSGQFLS